MQAPFVCTPSHLVCAHNSSPKHLKESLVSVFPPSNRKAKQQWNPARASLTDEDPPPPSSTCTRQSVRKNLFLLDVAPLCYRGKKPSPSALIGWLKPLFLDVTSTQPIIAVLDGERGNEYRKGLLPTYKGNRNAFVPLSRSRQRQTWKGDDADLREAFPLIKSFMRTCHIPVISLEDAEADDVVASLTEQAVQKGMRVTIASPDKDFKQLLCENVQIVAPLADLKRWSFFTDRLYIDQHGCDPKIELSLRCLLGDKVDCIPGLAEFAPGFGRKTALKLLKKHGSLESLLHEASLRTVGKHYVQDALTQHAPVLWKNLEVLRLRRDLPIRLPEDWCVARDNTNDEEAFSKLEKHLKALQIQRARMDRVVTQNLSEHTDVRSFRSKNTSKYPTDFKEKLVFSSN